MHIKKSEINILEILNNVADKGKTALGAFGLYLLYRLIDKAIDKEYNFSVHSKNLDIDFAK